MRLTSLRLRLVMPSAATRSSTRRVDTPPTFASWTTLSRGAFGAAARLEQDGEVAALAQLGDLQLQAAHPGVPAPLAIAVALGAAPLRGALAVGRADLGRHLGLHERLAQHPHPSRQHIDVAVAPRRGWPFSGLLRLHGSGRIAALARRELILRDYAVMAPAAFPPGHLEHAWQPAPIRSIASGTPAAESDDGTGQPRGERGWPRGV
jgi:hypothetical protein